MEEYEVNLNGAQPQPEQPAPRKNAKRSPFADSPFITAAEMAAAEMTEAAADETAAPEMTETEAAEAEAELEIEIEIETAQAQSATEEEPVYEVVEEAPAPKKSKKLSKVGKRIIAAVLVLALVGGGCGITAACVNYYWTGYHNNLVGHINGLYEQNENLKQQIKKLQQDITKNSFTGNGNSVSGTPNTSPEGMTPGQVYAKCVDSVVHITATYSSFGSSGGSSMGSGFFISEDGFVITNHHVVDGATRITVTTHSNEEYDAVLVGSHAANDLAVLKVEATGLPYITLGSSTDLIVGDQVVAIGNPLGTLSATLTVGYVSGKDRTVRTDGTAMNMIQTDAAINSGNSGGPLLNMNGEVVGIISAKYSGTTSSGASIEGIGFAIPIDDVKETIAYIQEHGDIAQPYMGVELSAKYDGIGVYVVIVERDGAAEAAGMKAGDVIIAIDGASVRTLNNLSALLTSYRAGDTVIMTIYRNGNIMEFPLTFGIKPTE